jgi:hypothetical protein
VALRATGTQSAAFLAQYLAAHFRAVSFVGQAEPSRLSLLASILKGDLERLLRARPCRLIRAALDALAEICSAKASIVNRVRAWKQPSTDLVQRITMQLDQPSIARMRIVSTQKPLNLSI